MGFRAGLDLALCNDRGRRLEHLQARSPQQADESMVGAARSEFLVDADFFATHRIGLAFVVVLLLLAAILSFIAVSWRQDRVAAWLFAPYAAWVGFASVLNASILVLN